MYTLTVFDSAQGLETKREASELSSVLERIACIVPGLDLFEVALSARRGGYVGQYAGVYVTIARLQ